MALKFSCEKLIELYALNSLGYLNFMGISINHMTRRSSVFKKMMTIFMVFAIFAVQAHASTHDGLKAAFDEMNFAVTVEWDQKDKNFYEAQLKKFTTTVRELQKKGLTNAEMIAFAKSHVKDAKVAKDLDTAFSMITINKMNSEEASKYVIDSMKSAYSSGASWTGSGVLYVAAALLLVALAVGVANGNVSGGGYGNGGGGYCVEDCYYYEYQCGYDWFRFPAYCEDLTCDTVCY